VDKIDTRHGYFHRIAKSTNDFSKEIREADEYRFCEAKNLQYKLDHSIEKIPKEKASYVQQLVNAISLPIEDEDAQELGYEEEHHSKGALDQDQLMIHIIEWLKDQSYKPTGFTDKQLDQLRRLGNRFLIYEGHIYRRGIEGQHCLYVAKQRRTFMMTAAHDHNGHRGFFATRSLLSQRFWWPEMERDINQFVKSCHACQERQMQLVRIPPVPTYMPSISI
jgi:hypothetical protein